MHNSHMLCDKCGQPVPNSNDAVLFDYALSGNMGLMFAQARHLLPTEDCEGSPSRAQYLPGQKRDERSEYPFDPDMQERACLAWAKMQELAASFSAQVN